ncbi:hypothetical protein DPSP01_004656 [Paraphaeosphaeria sporulosa]
MKSIIASTALLAATASAEVLLSKAAWVPSQGIAKIVNRCSYPVYLWSIDKELGCPSDAALKLNTGDVYKETMKNGTNGGISIKLSKKSTCGGEDITQLEYKLNYDPAYVGNYLDMSFVDCTGNLEDCPGRTDGFYLKAGAQTGAFKSAVNNEHCPVFNVYNAEEAAKVSYINWNDPQTKYCALGQDLDLYLCGGDAPSDEGDDSAAPSTEIKSSSAQPTSTSSSSEEAAPSTTEEANFVVAAAAAVTEAPAAAPVIKTEVVYVTEFVKARHAHGRRHQHFHA